MMVTENHLKWQATDASRPTIKEVEARGKSQLKMADVPI